MGSPQKGQQVTCRAPLQPSLPQELRLGFSCALSVSTEQEERREPDHRGKHFQTLFTTVTVTKSSLGEKKASFSLSLKKEQIELTGVHLTTGISTEILGLFSNTIS